ncbi:YmzC family protein [Bacillus velezensis]|nr:YmzC family protein [Bacillus velezensis]
MFESENELRRIRITLVWIAVFLLFGACGNHETVVTDDDGGSSDAEPQTEGMVRLEHNRFGIVEDGYLKIYRYDEKTNKIELKKKRRWMSLNKFHKRSNLQSGPHKLH